MGSLNPDEDAASTVVNVLVTGFGVCRAAIVLVVMKSD